MGNACARQGTTTVPVIFYKYDTSFCNCCLILDIYYACIYTGHVNYNKCGVNSALS